MNYDDLGTKGGAETSHDIKKHVIAAQERQRERYKDENITLNSQLSAAQMDKYCALDDEGRQLIKKAFDIMGLSARAYHKILKVARTIADLDKAENIGTRHLAEAIQYRSLDRKYWS